ncbi:helix-turn-helix domain-containing protein [Brucella intermedia]|uniref:helix-turn-helix domain-containing protein n=1 Tax=Brucella intermedia TaxID=94625 RepID=UPI00235F2A6D|nr:XRE family transcriptional regulator [Brucella intermedia]
MSFKISPRPESVRRIRTARQLSLDAVAASSGVKLEDLQLVETTGLELSKSKIRELASALSVPIQYLFFKDVLVGKNIPDFRTPGNKPAIVTPAGLSKIDRARSIIDYLSDTVFDGLGGSDIHGVLTDFEDVKYAVRRLSSVYEPRYDKSGNVDPDETFRELRVDIEKRGVLVLCDKIKNENYRGFCFGGEVSFPLIFINTFNQRPATKLFTFVHEIVHVMLGETGVSDPSILDNKVERFCNRVTAEVMMPSAAFEAYFGTLQQRTARRIATSMAKRFGVSKQAAALRIQELGLQRDFYSAWVKSLPAQMPLIEEEEEKEEAPQKGGGIGAQVARFGYLLPKVVGRAISKRHISPLDAFQLTNLKPSTMAKLSEIGSSRLGQ